MGRPVCRAWTPEIYEEAHPHGLSCVFHREDGPLPELRPVRLERTTYSLEGYCSIQLSYGRMMDLPT